jgi:hypothetical protein
MSIYALDVEQHILIRA